MKICFTSSLVLFFSLNALCQHSQLSFSGDFKFAETGYTHQIVSHSVYHNDNFYTVANSGASAAKWVFTKLYDIKLSVTVSKFDREMNKIKELKLDNASRSYGPLLPELFLLNNKLFLAYFQSDNKTSFNFFLARVDENDLTLRDTKKIATIQQENVSIFKAEAVILGNQVSFSNTPDNKKMLVACNVSPTAIQTFVLDDQLNILKKSTVPINTVEFYITSAVVTDDNLECLVLSHEEQETKIVCISPEGKKTQKLLKGSGNLSPFLAEASLSRDGKSIYIYATATLSNQKEMGCRGVLLQQLDCNTLQFSKTLGYPFSPEFIEMIAQKGGGIKSRKETSMFWFDPVLIELDNGDIVILGSPEKTTSETSTKTSFDMNMNMQTSTVATTTTTAGPVIVFFPDKNGKSFDHVLIPKNSVFARSARSGYGSIQMVQTPGIFHSTTSFIAQKSGDDIVVLYNDNETNLAKEADEKITTTFSSGKLVMAEALISKDKKLQYRKQIGEKLQGSYTYYLGNAIPNSSSSVIFPVGKQGVGFNARKTFYTNWCFINMK
jgi:hypothetical protein